MKGETKCSKNMLRGVRMSEKGVVYRIINTKNSKSYVGQTKRTLSDRKSSHKHGMNSGVKYSLYKAMRKYGWIFFAWEVLEECNLEDLEVREKYYILKYNTLEPNGYNMTLNTCGNLGYDFSGENNPRYGDYRTWEELHGKEKADELRKKSSEHMKNSPYNIIYWKRRTNYNPMDYSKHRKTLSKMRTGGNNPMAIYNYIFELPDGMIYETDCLREFCRETGFLRYILTRMCNREGYKPRDPFYRGWVGKKVLKEDREWVRKKEAV